MAASLVCSEEMMDESPDVSSELNERKRYIQEVPPEVVHRQRELTAFSDVNLIQDKRVFQTMLQLEKRCVGYVNNYFKTVQDDLTPDMKTDVAVWMFEVCDEERMHDAVFLRAVQYMDKFLSLQRISRAQLQLLGAVCLLLSSKIAGTTISPPKLVAYTANSVTTNMLMEWEEFVLAALKWDVYGVVSSDFVQQILHFLPRQLWDTPVISERIKTFTAYCAVDHQFGVHLPSVIASASIVAAMTPFVSPESMNQVLSTIQSVTNIDVKQLAACKERITAKVQLTVEEKLKNQDRQSSESSSSETEANGSSKAAIGSGIKAR